jgi:tRNA-guanine family transglycosylase
MATYIPACGFEILNMMKKYPEYDIFGNDGVFKYGIFLVSAYYGLGNKKHIEGVRDDVFILGDSGGFQQLTLGKNYDRDIVLNWQEENCTAGMIKDYPCLPEDNTETLYKKQELTCTDALWMLDNRKRVKLYDIYFGNSIKDFERMHSLYQGANFDGHALGSLPPIAPNTALILSRILSIINVVGTDKPIHVLGASGVSTTPVLHYMAHKFKVELTYDSSSFSYGSRRRQYRLPFCIRDTMVITNRDNNHGIKELPCSCPVCETIDVEVLQNSGSFPGFVMDLHNLYLQASFTKTLNSLVHNEEIYKDFVKRISPKAYENLALIDLMYEEGIEKAIRQHEYKGAGSVNEWV